MSLGLAHPILLCLLLLLPVVWLLPRRGRRFAPIAIRSLVLVSLVLALAEPVRVTRDRTEYHAIVLDATRSVATEEGARAQAVVARLLEALPPRARASVIAMGAAGAAAGDVTEREARTIPVTGAGSPLAVALAAASGTIPAGARGAVTLLSDGLATDRHWGPATQALSARGVPVHTVGLESVPADVRPVAIAAEGPLRVGATARLLVDVIGDGVEVSVVLEGPNGELARVDGRRVEDRAQVRLEFEPEESGFLPVEVRVVVTRGDDSVAEDNRLARTLPVQDPVRVLYLGGRMIDGARRVGGLLGRGFEVVTGDADDPGESLPLDGFDAVALDDRSAEQLPPEIQRELIAAVRDRGTGLFVSGGAAAFGPGGYHGTPIEEIFPVESIQKEEKKDPSTALAIIIDTSGSMSGNRMRLAKEVTRLAIRRLLPHDKVGIVEFYGTKRWAAPLQSAANSIDIERALNRLDAGGGTILLPAIEEAYYGLKNVQTRYKHVLMLTDAGVETGPYEKLLRRMARDGMCVSTVLVGPDRHSEFLVQLADWGNGRYYNASDRFNLPEVILKQPSTARLPAYRPDQVEVEPRGGRAWWGEVDPTGVPALAGYVETRLRPGAELVLQTRPESHPVLATWQFGLGRVTAFTSEPAGPGTEPWRDWPDYGPFLARVVSRTARDARLPYRFDIERQGPRVRVSAERREPTTARPEAMWLTGEDDDGDDTKDRALALRERADGVFEATILVDPDREVRVSAGTDEPAHGRERLVSDARADVAPELQVDPLEALDLDRLTAATGGQRLTLDELAASIPPTGGGADPRTVIDLWPHCVLAALLLFLGDIAYRRRPQRGRRPGDHHPR